MACEIGAVQVAQHIDACAWRTIGCARGTVGVLHGVGESLWRHHQDRERIGGGGAQDHILAREAEALLNLRDIVEDMGYSVYACVETLNAEGEAMIVRKRVGGNAELLAASQAQGSVSEKSVRSEVSGTPT